MLPERYDYRKIRDYRQYEFYSEGPRGRIRKIILYGFAGTWDGYDHYNLGFGDYDLTLDQISDLTVSDNLDRDKILATVAATTLEFTERFKGCRILVRGSTPSRTRLYQMKIGEYYGSIAELFDVQGLTMHGIWSEFRRGENYQAFIIRRK